MSGLQAADEATASAGKYVELQNAGANGTLTFTINAPSAGNYTLKISEAIGKPNSWKGAVDVLVNDTFIYMHQVSGVKDKWEDFHLTTVTDNGWNAIPIPSNGSSVGPVVPIPLNQGSNTITLRAKWASNQNIDYISIDGIDNGSTGGGDTGGGSTGDGSQTTLTAYDAHSSVNATNHGFPISRWTHHFVSFNLSNISSIQSARLKVEIGRKETPNFNLIADEDTVNQKTVSAEGSVEIDVTNLVHSHLGGQIEFDLRTDNGDYNYISSTTPTQLILETAGGGTTVNQAPVARINSYTQSGTAPLSITFDASASTDPDGDNLGYSWDFDDGNTATTQQVQHSYTTPGTYTPTLTVSDGSLSNTIAGSPITVSAATTGGGTNTGGLDKILADRSRYNDDGESPEPVISPWGQHTVKLNVSDVAQGATASYRTHIKPANSGNMTVSACAISITENNEQVLAPVDLDWSEGTSAPLTKYSNTNNSVCEVVYGQTPPQQVTAGEFASFTVDISNLLTAAQGKAMASFSLQTNTGWNTLATKENTDANLHPEFIIGSGTTQPPTSSGAKVGTNMTYLNTDVRQNTSLNAVAPFKSTVDFESMSDTFNPTADQYISSDKPWDDNYLDKSDWNLYSVLRTLNWHYTNVDPVDLGKRTSPDTLWKDRIHRNEDGQDQHWDNRGGMSWEWIIDFVNEISSRHGTKDVWITLPHNIVQPSVGPATHNPNDYAHKLAILLKHGVDMGEADLADLLTRAGNTVNGNPNYRELKNKPRSWFIERNGKITSSGLRPESKIYVEYSNEVWNTKFIHNQEIAGWAKRLDENPAYSNTPFLTDKARRRLDAATTNTQDAAEIYGAYASLRIWNAFIDVYGDDTGRFFKVVGARKGLLNDNDRSTGGFYDVDDYLIDKQHIFTSSFWNPLQIMPDYIATAPYFGNSQRFKGVSQVDMEEMLLSEVDLMVETAERYAQQLKANNVPYSPIFYETGQHLDSHCIALNTSNLMGTAYKNYYEGLEAIADVDVIMNFTEAGGFQDDGNCWGLDGGNPDGNLAKQNAFRLWVNNR